MPHYQVIEQKHQVEIQPLSMKDIENGCDSLSFEKAKETAIETIRRKINTLKHQYQTWSDPIDLESIKRLNESMLHLEKEQSD